MPADVSEKMLNDADEIGIVSVAAATCLGNTIEATWAGVLEGRCGVGAMSELESPVPAGKDGGQALPLPAEFAPDLPRVARYLRWTIDCALRDGKIDLASFEPGRISLVLGTTLHGMRSAGQFLRTRDYSKLSTFLAGDVARLANCGLPIGGASLTTCSACSSSLGAVALGATLLRNDEADLVIAGGYDAISEYAYAGFDALRLISDAPLRPFAKGRTGMKVGEGYGIVVLVRCRDAARLGRPPLAIVASCGESADAFHLTRPHPEGAGALVAMRAACSSAGIRPSDLDLIAAHATGTFENDNSEAAAITALLGDDSRRVPIVGFKSHLGHTLGGAGAVELALSVQAIQSSTIPPTANACEVEYDAINVNTTRLTRPIRHTLNTSLGFGGANTCIVLRSPGQARLASSPTPRSEVVITGIGVLAPGAIGNDAFAELADGNRTVDRRTIDDAEYEPLVPNARRLRRMSTYVKLSICAATIAARDAQLLDSPELLRGTGAMLGSTHGSAGYCYDYYEQIVREGMAAANPMLFAEGVPNAAAAQLSLTLGLTGPCQTILGTTTAGLDALRLAMLRIAGGEADRLIVCAAEEAHSVVDAAYNAVCGGRPSVSVAVAFVLERRDVAERRGAGVRAVLGAGSFAKKLRGESDAAFYRRTNAFEQQPRIQNASIDFNGGSAFSVEPLLTLAAALLRRPGESRFEVSALSHDLVTAIEVGVPAVTTP